jgi:quercetin dioxygenase-like cupin family protein
MMLERAFSVAPQRVKLGVHELNGKYKLRVTEATFQPRGYVGDHHHLAPGIRLVTSGELTFVRGSETTIYKAGDTFFESGDVTHRVYNRGSASVVLVNL